MQWMLRGCDIVLNVAILMFVFENYRPAATH
jgi:hypothetical protein